MDSIGGAIKCSTACASLWGSFNDQILTVEAVHNLCGNGIESIIFNFIHKHELVCQIGKLGKCSEKEMQFLGHEAIISSVHCLLIRLLTKRMSNDDEFTGTFTFSDAPIPNVSKWIYSLLLW